MGADMPLRNAQRLALTAAIVALPLMRYAGLPVGNTWLIPADAALVGLVVLVLLDPEGRRRAIRSRLFAPCAAYVAFWSLGPLTGRAGLLEWTQVAYLAAVAAATSAVAGRPGESRRAIRAWAYTAGALAAAAIAIVLLWYAGARSLVGPLLSSPGSLPPGPYPRLALLFFGPNQLASYLLVGAVLCYALDRGAGDRSGPWLTGVVTVGLASTLSLALGALVTVLLLAEGLRRRSRVLAAAAALAVAATVLAAAVSLPALARGRIEPSVRWQTWGAALASIGRAPLLGEAPGEEMEVRYVAPDGNLQRLVDAHDTLLDVARRAGLPAAVLLAWILWRVLRDGSAALSGPRLAVLAAWLLHGLFGSFENTRHLWVLLGIAAGASAVPGDDRVAQPRGDRLDPVERLGRERDE